MAKNDGIRHLHHGGFEVQREQYTVFGARQLLLVKGAKGVLAHERGINNFTGEIVDAAFMSKDALCAFYEEQLASTEDGVLFSLHLKATMMKVSDPIIFGHAVKAYYRDAFTKHADVFAELGVDPNNGVGDAYDKIQNRF